MLRFIFYIVAFYFIYRGIKSLLSQKPDQDQVKGKPPEKNKPHIDRTKIEDAKFKDVDE